MVSAAQSDTSFLGRVKDKWGDEESELRQAIFFQFIKTKSVIGTEDDVLGSVVSSLDRSIDEERNNYGIVDETTYSKLSGGKDSRGKKSKPYDDISGSAYHNNRASSNNPINITKRSNDLGDSGRSVKKIQVSQAVDELTFEAPLSGPEQSHSDEI